MEFVSANPTGPLTIGHARNAAIGDALARLLTFAGHEVEREYYFNDAGGQMDRFGASVEARYLQLLGRDAELPEDGYHGEYVADLARDILARRDPGSRTSRRRSGSSGSGTRAPAARWSRSAPRSSGSASPSTAYFLEASLVEKGEIAQAIERLREGGVVYEAEGATWFRSTAFGDDKDRVRDPLGRDAHVLRRRLRLRDRQVLARVRPPDLRLGRGSPRRRRARAGGGRRPSASIPTASRS